MVKAFRNVQNQNIESCIEGVAFVKEAKVGNQ